MMIFCRLLAFSENLASDNFAFILDPGYSFNKLGLHHGSIPLKGWSGSAKILPVSRVGVKSLKKDLNPNPNPF